MVVVVRPAPDPRKWDLVMFSLSEDGKTETLTYERTIDDVTETKDVHRPSASHEAVLARRSREEMTYDALFIHAVNAAPVN